MVERSRASGAAAAILAWFATQTRWRPGVATPVDSLARQLGLEIATFDAALHPGVWGYLEPGEDLIFVRASLSEPARRFTLAHEIGHAALHRGYGQAAAIVAGSALAPANVGEEPLDVCHSADVETFDLVVDETLGTGQTYQRRAGVEQEANAFAVALLMSEEPFRGAYLDLCHRPRALHALGGSTRALAKRFGVSEDAALRRLQSLLGPGSADDATLTPATFAQGDAEQMAAARLEPPALVMAGPGAGKTATLVARAVHLVIERGAQPDELLAVTFSRKAAAELRSRVQAALEERGRFGSPYVSTIHGFCLDLLRKHGHLVGLPADVRVAPEIETYFMIRQIMREEPLKRLAPTHAPDLYVRDIQQTLSRAKDDLLDADRLAENAARAGQEATGEVERATSDIMSDVAVVFARYQQVLRERGVVDYGDVIALGVRLLDEQPEIARDLAYQWPHLLVDEYQDINRAMGALIERLVAAGCGLWAVGDADQAIYRFRGADPEVVSRFGVTYPGARIAPLVRNYRSQRLILAAASAFAIAYSRMDDRLALEPSRESRDSQMESTPTVHLAVAETGADEIAGLARAIEERRQAGRAYHDQVVLLRTRRQTEAVVEGLRQHGVPVAVYSSALERNEVKRFLAVISLLGGPSGAGLIRAGSAPEHAFARAEAIAALGEARRQRRPLGAVARSRGEIAGVTAAGRVGLRKLGRILAAMRASASVATALCLYCFAFTTVGARLLAAGDASDEDALALRRLLDIARAFDSQREPIGATDGPRADWGGFAEFLGAARLLRLDSVEVAGNAGVGAVRVMTAHASKGLEFPVVYLPQLVNRRFPLSGRMSALDGVVSTESSAGGGGLSEEAALFYVAMTRARDELVLSYARVYGRMSYTASPFLDPIAQTLGDSLALTQWLPDRWQPEAETPRASANDAGPATAGGGVYPARESTEDEAFDLAELEAYQRCPRQYAYRYVDDLWAPTPLSALFGKATARASRDLDDAFAESRERKSAPPGPDEAQALIERHWREALEEERRHTQDGVVGDASSLEAYYARQAQLATHAYHEALLRRGISLTPGDARPRESRTRHVTARLGDIMVRGVVDMYHLPAEREPGQASEGFQSGKEPEVIVSHRRRSAGSSPTLRELFAEAVAQQERTEAGPARVFERNPTTGAYTAVTLSARQRARLTREAQEAGSGIRRGDFHAAPDEWKCQRCPFAFACPE